MFVLQPISKLVKGKIHRVEKTQKMEWDNT